jgi:2-C-methyl-D-erythritol 4-phosphate cytidylyltransferase/2-C-methyl-D-erythritol 2,4-cyclodiphosphate synthase
MIRFSAVPPVPVGAYPPAVAIVPAGGSGTRMGVDRPKQYLLLHGRPVLAHTLARLQESSAVAAIILVVRPEDRELCARLGLDPAGFGKIRVVADGGAQRWQTVRAGLAHTLPDDHVVLVHDGVRPFVSHAVLARVAAAAWEHGAAVAAVPVQETIKEAVDGCVRATPDRRRLWVAQTPQGFRRAVLLEAYAAARVGTEPTDDATLVERMGLPVRLVDGDGRNLKITTPEDLDWAAHQLTRDVAMASAQVRVGHGFDVHALVQDRALVLGGVTVPFECGLAGHSDADVLTHAIIDALLGAAGCGDIGRLFPDTDPAYAGISSLVLLERTCALLAQRGAALVNVDAVVMAQRPRLAPHIGAMVAALARTMGIAPDRVSIKATTTEALGFVGREEGLAAQAVALIQV